VPLGAFPLSRRGPVAGTNMSLRRPAVCADGQRQWTVDRSNCIGDSRGLADAVQSDVV